MSSRTIPSAWARMGRRISRSSSSSRCAPFPASITLRPADANEVVEAWRVIIALSDQPACLALSRQALPTFDRARYASASGVRRGAYVLADAEDAKPAVILIGTGSEVSLCIEAYEELTADRASRRASSACRRGSCSKQQDQAYRDGVLPPGRHRPGLRGDGFGDRLGSLRRRDRREDRHARLRRFGSAQGSAREVRVSRRRPSLPPRRNRLQSQEGRRRHDRAGQDQATSNPFLQLRDHGQAIWLDFLSRRFIADGSLKNADRQGWAYRRHLQSLDLRKGRSRQRRLRCVAEGAPRRGDRDVMALYEQLAIEDIRHAADVLRPVYERDQRPGRLCQPRGVALSGDGHRRDDRGRRAAVARGRPRQPDDQGAGDKAGPAGDPPAHRRRHQRQHHAAVLAKGL